MEKKIFDQFSDDRLHQQVSSFYITAVHPQLSKMVGTNFQKCEISDIYI